MTLMTESIQLVLLRKLVWIYVCGGLFGMGESMQDRVDLAFALSELDVDSVPVNFLDPRPGTAFHGKPNPLTPNDCLRALAMMRFVIPSVEIRIAGGRETTLKHFASCSFISGQFYVYCGLSYNRGTRL